MANNAEKYPDLWKAFQVLCDEEQQLEEATAGLKAQRRALVEKIAPLQDEMRKLTTKINEIERPRIIDIRNQKSALAKAMGGRRLSQPETPEEETSKSE